MSGRIIRSSFSAPWWVRNPHLQTVWGPLFRREPRPVLQREVIQLGDGDRISLDWHVPSEDRPLVILLHGLTGSSASPYARGLQHAFGRRGWSSLVLHFRGADGRPNDLPRIYHSGDTGDLSEVIALLRKRTPDRPIAVVGVSLGGSVTLNWLGEQSDSAGVVGACAISVPLVLAICSLRMDRGVSRLYRNRLVGILKNNLREKQQYFLRQGTKDHAKILASLGDLDGIERFWQFDQQIVAPLHGFKSAEDYYARCSSRRVLGQIKVPTLILHARDDPFMTSGVLPSEEELSPFVTLEVSEQGGHVGFVHGDSPADPRYWLDRRVPDFIAGLPGFRSS